MYLNLKFCLLELGIRQNRLAKEVRIDETLLSKIINGFREPSPTQRKRIARSLQKDEAWLFAPYHAPNPVRGNSSGSQERS